MKSPKSGILVDKKNQVSKPQNAIIYAVINSPVLLMKGLSFLVP